MGVTHLQDVSVLLVEDNKVNQRLAMHVLKKAGCEIDIAENGLIAIQQLLNKSYDVVLMDIQMPEMDGYEATQYIRTQLQPPLSQIPIIAMTAHAISTESVKCMKVGMNDYISKPFDSVNLINKIAMQVKEKSYYEMNVEEEKAEASTKPLEEVIDITSLSHSYDGDSELITEIITIILQESPDNQQELLSYSTQKDWQNLKKLSHRIKTSYGIVGAVELQEILVMIESACSGESIEEEEVKAYVALAAELISRVTDELNNALLTL
jgi:CheY-like chemotaxis protein